jgi:uncharacterized damage-inducible protein DinB
MQDHAYLFSGLRNAPHELVHILAEMPDELEHEPLAKGGWSPHQIVSHLEAVNREVYRVRLQRILDETNPVFEDFDEKAWMAVHYLPSVPMDELVAKFTDLCDEAAEWLEELPDEAWERLGTHPTRGTHTLEWWADRMEAHVTEHLAQLRGE